jgi:hypothetical protein
VIWSIDLSVLILLNLGNLSDNPYLGPRTSVPTQYVGDIVNDSNCISKMILGSTQVSGFSLRKSNFDLLDLIFSIWPESFYRVSKSNPTPHFVIGKRFPS